MKKLMYIAATCGTIILAGCASLDDRLASSDPRVRSAAERELLQTSRATGTEADRIAAIKRITDKDYLYEIALHATTNQWIADDATFDASPYDGFQKSPDGKTRVYYKLTSISGKLADYTRVKGRIIDTTKEGVAAVGQLKFDDCKRDEFVKLHNLVHKAESDQVKLAAFKVAKDPKRSQTLAVALARATKDASVQSEALAKMDPEKRLVAIALNGANEKAKLDAFNNLKDPKAIDEVVLKTKDKEILLAGIVKTTDKALLAPRIFSNDFTDGKDTVELKLVLAYLKLTKEDRKDVWDKFTKDGKLEEVEMTLAKLYRKNFSVLDDENRRLLISSITIPSIISKMINPSSADKKVSEIKRKLSRYIFETKTIQKIKPKWLELIKNRDEWMRWRNLNSSEEVDMLAAQIPDLTNYEKDWLKHWFSNGNCHADADSIRGNLKWYEDTIARIKKELSDAQAQNPKSLYIEKAVARTAVLTYADPIVLDKVFPFKGILGIKFGEVVDTKGGRFEHGAQGVAPASTRVPFTPQRGLPQFSSYWYRASIKSHRVFMIEAKTEAPLDRNEFDNLVKSLEKKYGQTADKWKGEGMDVGDAVGDIKTFFVTRYTFHFPGNRRLVLEDRARRFGGGIMDEVIMSQSVDKKKRGYVSLVAYDDNAMKAADAEVGAAARERKQREEKKSADAAKRISDAL